MNKRIVDLESSESFTESDSMFVKQEGKPVWVGFSKIKEFIIGLFDYNSATNKPKINNVELSGNKTLDELGIQPKIAEVIEDKVAVEKPVEAPKVIAEEAEIPKIVSDEVQADNLYTKTELDTKFNAKLDKNQGSLNAGKYLKVGSDGSVEYADITIPSGGTTDYNELENLPTVGGVEVKGALTLDQLGIQPKGDYLVQSDLEGYAEDSDIPTKLPSPEKLTIQLDEVSYEYDGSTSKSFIITPESIGAQPEGDYVTSTKHNSDMNLKLNVQQSTSNSGKFLSVGSNGQITFVDKPSGGGGGGSIDLLKNTGLTSMAVNATITVSGMSNYDMIGIECLINNSEHTDEYSDIQWFYVGSGGTINCTLHGANINSGSDYGELHVRRISINVSSGVIKSISDGYWYNWGNKGKSNSSVVPHKIYGIKFS